VPVKYKMSSALLLDEKDAGHGKSKEKRFDKTVGLLLLPNILSLETHSTARFVPREAEERNEYIALSHPLDEPIHLRVGSVRCDCVVERYDLRCFIDVKHTVHDEEITRNTRAAPRLFS